MSTAAPLKGRQPTRPDTELARQWRQVRFNPLPRATPSTLASDLDAFKAGYLRSAALLWDAIELRDYMAKVAIGKRKKAAARRSWEIVMTEDTPEAQRHKETLEWFYNHLTATDALDLNVRGGMRLLVSQMMDAEFKFYSVHEILWTKPLVTLPGGGRSMQAELRFVPLCLFENLTGRLRYTGPLQQTEGSALEDGGWMITAGAGLMEAISVCWMLKKLSLADWLNFSEKFGIPGIHGEINAAEGSPEWDNFVEALEAFASDWIMASASGTKVNLIEAGKTGDQPFKPMVEHMDRAIACLCRGADLSTISAKDSAGASLQADETILLEADDCELVGETLNVQLGRLVIGHLYGPEVEPLAYLKISPPTNQDTKLDIEVDNHLVRHGVPVSIADMAERYARTLPDDDEELVKPRNSGRDGIPPEDNRNAAPPKALENAADPETEALRSAVVADLEPVREALARILGEDSADSGRDRLAELELRWPEITEAVLAGDALERAMERIFSSAFVEGLDLAAAAAAAAFENANPYHDARGRFTTRKGAVAPRKVDVPGENPASPSVPVSDWKSQGRPDISAVTGKPMPELVTATDGFQILKTGGVIIDPTGQLIAFNDRVLEHWVTSAKPAADKKARLERIHLSLDAVKDPLEIWTQPNGNRFYLQVYEKPSGKVLGGVAVSENGALLTLYSISRPNRLNHARRGILEYAH